MNNIVLSHVILMICIAGLLSSADALNAPQLQPRLRTTTRLLSTTAPSLYSPQPSLNIKPPAEQQQSLDKFAGDDRDVQVSRVGIAAALSVLCVNSDRINAAIAYLWSVVRSNPIFRLDMFEPAVAVSAFFVWVHIWYYLDRAAVGGRLPWLLKHRIAKPPVANEDPMQSSAAWARERATWYSDWWRLEAPVYLLPLLALSVFFDAFAPRRLALAQAAPSLWRVAREVLGGLFFYDLFFWITHVPLHMFPSVYKRFHARHHHSPEVQASDVVRLTPVEELIDVACSIAGLRILQAHPISRSIYNIVITGLLTELHCGYDLPFSLQNVVPFGIWGGSRRHHIHHRHGRAYFQKFFTYLDNLFGRFVNKPERSCSRRRAESV